jgi:hypothetical protein
MKDKLKGGLADKMSKKDIADKFDITLQKIDKELNMGIKVEMEHVNSKARSREIAMDHLVEIPDYYTRLKKMEKEGKKKWKVDESAKSNIKRLVREQLDMSVTDETSDSTSYEILYKTRPAGMVVITDGPEMLENSIEIAGLKLNAAHEVFSFEVIKELLLSIWQTYDVDKILVMPTALSKDFWGKMGGTRLNDKYYVMMRGH